MEGPFQEYSVQKSLFVCLFWIEQLEIKANLMQAIQHMAYFTKTW